MNRKRLLKAGLAAGVTTASLYLLWKRSQQETEEAHPIAPEQAYSLLEKAAPLLRLPTAPDRIPEVLADGSGLRCPVTHRVYLYRKGILDLLPPESGVGPDPSFIAWISERMRSLALRLLRLPGFQQEAANLQRQLQLCPGENVLDLACGSGHFAIEWAQEIGPEGLVIGIDPSAARLTRAVHHVYHSGLGNILLVRADPAHLPLADGCLKKVASAGGFHQFPRLEGTLTEIARVSAPGATLAASTFAEGPRDPNTAVKAFLKERFGLHFVPLLPLGEHLAQLGYPEYHWSLPGGWFGYALAQKEG